VELFTQLVQVCAPTKHVFFNLNKVATTLISNASNMQDRCNAYHIGCNVPGLACLKLASCVCPDGSVMHRKSCGVASAGYNVMV